MPETKKKSNIYVTNEEIIPLIFEYRRTGKISETFGEKLLLIAENVANKGNFHGYTWKEDMISEALLTANRYIHNFDPIRYEKPNPFAYITTIISRAFLTYIAKQKKHSHIKNICYNNHELLDMDEDEECLDNQKSIDYTNIQHTKKTLSNKYKKVNEVKEDIQEIANIYFSKLKWYNNIQNAKNVSFVENIGILPNNKKYKDWVITTNSMLMKINEEENEIFEVKKTTGNFYAQIRYIIKINSNLSISKPASIGIKTWEQLLYKEK